MKGNVVPGIFSKLANLPESCAHPTVGIRLWQVVTHAPLIVALGFLGEQGRWLYFWLLFAAILFSIAHHVKPEWEFLMWAEWILVIAVSVYLFVEYINDFDTADWVFLSVAIGFFFWSLFEFYFKSCRHYDLAHCAWHLIGGILLLKLVIQNPPSA